MLVFNNDTHLSLEDIILKKQRKHDMASDAFLEFYFSFVKEGGKTFAKTGIEWSRQIVKNTFLLNKYD